MNGESLIAQMQHRRYEVFKAQDRENGHFDVTFKVDGKLIYANKYVLVTISPTFESMLSERWTKKDEVIKLENYSYDNFYRLLTIIYSGNCDLTLENVANTVDMAEFYGVADLKKFCDVYVSRVRYNPANLFDLIDLVEKYALPKSKATIEGYIRVNLPMILQSDQFMNLQKQSLENFLALQRGLRQEEQLFEAVCKWAENQFTSNADTAAPNAVVCELAEPLSCIRMKAELSGILPHIHYDRMSHDFFHDRVVPKSSLFMSKAFNDMLANREKITVTITDSNGRSLSGCFVDKYNISGAINTVNGQPPKWRGTNSWTCTAPSPKPSELKRKQDFHNCQFYFVLSADRHLEVQKPDEIGCVDRLLCEMKGDSDFVFDRACKISYYRNCFAP